MTVETNVDRYEMRGVSSLKTDVHNAIKNLDKGIFPKCFCKVNPDYLGGDKKYCNISHNDGTGTKLSLAYVYWKLTGDLSVWKGVAQDAIVMNLDDLICAGVTDENIILSSNIARNKNLISGEVISAIINANNEIAHKLRKFGVNIYLGGGETADLGDLVRTIVVDAGMVVRMQRKDVINQNIRPDDVIVGLSSTGKATYEEEENSGIGSNGLTSARHDSLNSEVAKMFPESYDHNVSKKLTYCGPYFPTDQAPLNGFDWGKFILSPTRTYAPIIIELSKHIKKTNIHGIIHCSGGGQTKCVNFVDDNVRIIKNQLFKTPVLFTEIQKNSKTKWEEMYKTFNMGHRLEIYCHPYDAPLVINISKSFGVEAKIVGKCVKRKNDESNLVIGSDHGVFEYWKSH